MKLANVPTLPFVGILVQDDKTKGYTAFFKQFPNVIAEGDNEEQALSNLIQTLKVVLECDSETSVEVPRNHVTQKTIEFKAVLA